MTNPVRLVIALLGAALLACVVGIIALAVLEAPVPDVLQNIAVGTMTALGALLARPSLTSKDEPR